MCFDLDKKLIVLGDELGRTNLSNGANIIDRENKRKERRRAKKKEKEEKRVKGKEKKFETVIREFNSCKKGFADILKFTSHRREQIFGISGLVG